MHRWKSWCFDSRVSILTSVFILCDLIKHHYRFYLNFFLQWNAWYAQMEELSSETDSQVQGGCRNDEYLGTGFNELIKAGSLHRLPHHLHPVLHLRRLCNLNTHHLFPWISTCLYIVWHAQKRRGVVLNGFTRIAGCYSDECLGMAFGDLMKVDTLCHLPLPTLSSPSPFPV